MEELDEYNELCKESVQKSIVKHKEKIRFRESPGDYWSEEYVYKEWFDTGKNYIYQGETLEDKPYGRGI